jgi:hypothetical protein
MYSQRGLQSRQHTPFSEIRFFFFQTVGVGSYQGRGQMPEQAEDDEDTGEGEAVNPHVCSSLEHSV